MDIIRTAMKKLYFIENDTIEFFGRKLFRIKL